ncbi:MAG: N-acetyltransferase [Betaproteobacteria bacterium]|nr:MAG: N-acetyltransferase [Betaproteobacteria bacterium]
MTPETLTEKIKAAPREILTARTRLTAPSLEQIPIRMAWAIASSDALHFLPDWRKSADLRGATRGTESEMRAVEAGDEIIYNVFEIATGDYVGRLDLHSWDADAPRCEIGYMADTRTSGRGLLREAAIACVELAFDIGAVRIQAMTDPRNTRSIMFAKALGMQEEGVLRNYERLDDVLCDQVLLSTVRTRP